MTPTGTLPIPDSPEWTDILGVHVHNVDYEQTLGLMMQFVESGRPHQVATVNPEFIMRARSDREFQEVLHQADLCLPDGVGVIWAGRLLGRPLKTRVAGVDTVWRLMEASAERGYRVFLLGAAPGVAERAAEVMCEAYPGLLIVGTYAGSPSVEQDEPIGKRILASRPDVLLVAYGAPAQDKWIHRNAGQLNVPLAIGVGGTLDFISGASQRAPVWTQKLGLEWLHRLYREPWRWRRMTALPLFALQVVWQRLSGDRMEGS